MSKSKEDKSTGNGFLIVVIAILLLLLCFGGLRYLNARKKPTEKTVTDIVIDETCIVF